MSNLIPLLLVCLALVVFVRLLERRLPGLYQRLQIWVALSKVGMKAVRRQPDEIHLKPANDPSWESDK